MAISVPEQGRLRHPISYFRTELYATPAYRSDTPWCIRAASSGLRIIDDGHYTDAGDGTCLSYKVVGGPENLRMLVEHGVVTTVEAYLDSEMPVFRTDRGVKLGDAEATVRAVYPSLKQLPDIYSAPPDKKLFYYEPGGERGIRFDINDGRVSGIAVGTTSIEYVEGCL